MKRSREVLKSYSCYVMTKLWVRRSQFPEYELCCVYVNEVLHESSALLMTICSSSHKGAGIEKELDVNSEFCNVKTTLRQAFLFYS